MKHKKLIRNVLLYAFLIQLPAMMCAINPTNQITYWYGILITLIALAVAATIVFLLSLCGGIEYLRDEEI